MKDRLTKILTILCFPFVMFAEGPDDFCSEVCTKIGNGIFDGSSANPVTKKDIVKAIELKCPCTIPAYSYLAFEAYNENKLEDAKNYLIKGEEIYLNGEYNPDNYAVNQVIFGLINIAKHSLDIANFHISKAAILIEDSENIAVRNFIYNNQALILLESNQLNEAEKVYLKLINDSEINDETGYSYLNLARIKEEQKDFENALAYNHKAEQIWKSNENLKGLYFSSLGKSSILYNDKQYNASIRELKRTRQIGEESNIKLLIGHIYHLEASCYLNLNDRPNELIAIKNSLKHISDLDPIVVKELSKRILAVSKDTNDKEVDAIFIELINHFQKEVSEANLIELKRNEILTTQITQKEDATLLYNEGKTRVRWLSLGFLLSLLVAGFFYALFRNIKSKNREITLLNSQLSDSNSMIESQITLLKERNQDLQRFAYVASHDLKSPLRTINSFTGLIEKLVGKENAKVNEYLKYVKDSAEQMSKLISDLLSHAVSENELNLQHFNLKDLIQQATNNLKASISESGAEIILEGIEQDQKVFCDKVKLIQVAQNLIGNSINYSKEDVKPKIKIKASNQGNSLKISFQDNGIGIPKESEDKVFKMFERLHDKKSAEGTGIGLATCKKIVETHKGSISCSPLKEQGTEFTILLPIA